MPKTRTILTLVLLPLLIFLVACGGDDDDSANTGDQPSTSDSNSSGSSNSGTSDSNSSSSSSSDSNSNNSASSSGTFENCPEFANFAASIATAFSGATPGSAATDLEDTVQYFQALADASPDEIRADMQVIAEAFGGFYSVLNDFNIDLSNPTSFASLTADQQAQLQTALEELGNPNLEEASNNVSAWFEANCN